MRTFLLIAYLFGADGGLRVEVRDEGLTAEACVAQLEADPDKWLLSCAMSGGSADPRG